MSEPIRSFQRGVLLLLLTVALGAAATQRAWPYPQADQPPPGKLKGAPSVANNLETVISGDDQGLSLMFSNFQTVCDSGNGEPLVVSQTQTFTAPVNSEGQGPTPLLLQLDCDVHTIGNYSATLIIQAGGKTRVVDLMEEIRINRPPTPSQAPAEHSTSDAASGQPGKEQPTELLEGRGSIFIEMAYRAPPKSQNPITITVLIERNDEDSNGWGYVTINLLNVVVIEPREVPAVSIVPPS